MDSANLAGTLEGLIAPVVAGLGLELYGLELAGGEGQLIVRVYIEREGGVTIDDCATVSRHIGLLLDVEDPIPGRYALEVSSPGLERPLFTPAQAAAHVGATVEVRLHAPLPDVPGRRNFKGELTAVEGDTMHVVVDGVGYALPFSHVGKCRLRVTDWDAIKKGVHC